MTSLIRNFYKLKLKARSWITAKKIEQSFMKIITESDKINSLIKDYRKNLSFAQKAGSRSGNRIFESEADEKGDKIEELYCIRPLNKRIKEIKSITIKLGRLLKDLNKNKDDNMKSYISSYTKAGTIVLPLCIASPRGFKYSTLFNGHRCLNCSRLNDTRRYSQITNSTTALDFPLNFNNISKIPTYNLADKEHAIYNDINVLRQQDLESQIKKIIITENYNILPELLLTGKRHRISIEVTKSVKKKKDDTDANARKKAKINFPTNRPESLCKKIKKEKEKKST